MNSAELTPFKLNLLPHPGETIVEYLEFHGWSQRDLARRTGLTPKTISEICNGKAPITPTTALALEKVLQRPAKLWLNLQRDYDEAEARARQRARHREWVEWAKCFPLRQMRQYNFSLPAGLSDVEALLQFFGVSSPESWDQVWKSAAVAYRQTRIFDVREEAIAAWVREVEIVAAGLDTSDFSEELLRTSLDAIRQLTREPMDAVMEPLQALCAKAGVAVVLVPGLPNTAISGCARWQNNRRALIGMTIRYRTDDQFWFTFFHELGHILLHRHKRTFVLDNAARDFGDGIVDEEMAQVESEANRFAANTLIPPQAYDAFVRRNDFSNDAIHDFAKAIGVGPGIVVGRLQHDRILNFYQGNSLKQTLHMGHVTEE